MPPRLMTADVSMAWALLVSRSVAGSRYCWPSSESERPTDLLTCRLPLTGYAFRVDPQEDCHAVARPLGDLGGRHLAVERGGDCRVPKVVRPPRERRVFSAGVDGLHFPAVRPAAAAVRRGSPGRMHRRRHATVQARRRLPLPRLGWTRADHTAGGCRRGTRQRTGRPPPAPARPLGAPASSTATNPRRNAGRHSGHCADPTYHRRTRTARIPMGRLPTHRTTGL